MTTTEGRPTPVGRVHHLIVDCPDSMTEARFWSALLGDPIMYADQDFMVNSLKPASGA
jgi:hypothetical protein